MFSTKITEDKDWCVLQHPVLWDQVAVYCSCIPYVVTAIVNSKLKSQCAKCGIFDILFLAGKAFAVVRNGVAERKAWDQTVQLGDWNQYATILINKWIEVLTHFVNFEWISWAVLLIEVLEVTTFVKYVKFYFVLISSSKYLTRNASQASWLTDRLICARIPGLLTLFESAFTWMCGTALKYW